MPGSADALPDEGLADWLAGTLAVRAVQMLPVGGGCIHSAWCLRVEPLEAPTAGPLSAPGGGLLFAKTNSLQALPWLEAEAEGLAALARAAEGTGLRVPAPLAVGMAGSQAVLVLPWFERAGSGATAVAWERLGASLASLHRRSLEHPCTSGDRPDRFGWPRDNWIGAGPQPNGWWDAWGPFFAERRLAPQLELLARRRGPLPGAATLLERVPEWLEGHQADPCLVHGDLWSGNAAINTMGEGVIFDPAVHRGDREVDLAMARLFGGFPSAFFAGYERTWPLPGDHRRRVSLYNLYHLLNHANLFGGSYAAQAEAVIRDLLKNPPG